MEDRDNLEVAGLFNSHASFHASPKEIVALKIKDTKKVNR